jgi:hypothetical protein
MPDGTWTPFKKSSFSSAGGCVEIAMSDRGDIRLRDSKSVNSPVLSFNRREWAAFLAGVHGGEFELPEPPR